MNTDVIPACGGFLPVWINESGYIQRKYGESGRAVIHLETRDLHLLPECCEFSEAKAAVDPALLHESWHDQVAVLELTPDGGGAAIWVREDQVEVVTNRRNKFKGCYGNWPVRTFQHLKGSRHALQDGSGAF